MFSVGQRVWHRDGKRGGTVLECDGERVYITQDNGAELDFRAADLTATPPPDPKSSGARVSYVTSAVTAFIENREAPRPVAYTVPTRTLTPADITPEHARVLGIIPPRTLQDIASVYERGSRARKFNALDVAAKLNAITEITAVPYRTMREYSDRPGELRLLMGKGLADSRDSR